MKGYALTEAADADLEELWQYIAHNSSPAAADRLEDELHVAMHRLAGMPRIGHVRSDVADEALRFFSVHKFLIVYRALDDHLQVIRVLHGARDVGAVLATDPTEPPG
jgi:toxin ParE1/3/4